MLNTPMRRLAKKITSLRLHAAHSQRTLTTHTRVSTPSVLASQAEHLLHTMPNRSLKPGIALRQGFTESGPRDAGRAQKVFKVLQKCIIDSPVSLLMPPVAYERHDFKRNFQYYSGDTTPADSPNFPDAFWNWRAERIFEALAFVVPLPFALPVHGERTET